MCYTVPATEEQGIAISAVLFTYMKIIDGFPPNYTDIQKVFPNCEEHQAVFCYGDTIFNPFKIYMRPDLEVHEEVHSKQQGKLPDVWWYKYLNDKAFRLQQEIEAYGTQYAFAKKHTSGKLLDWVKGKFAESLSGPLYGNLISYGEAESKIRNYAKRSILNIKI